MENPPEGGGDGGLRRNGDAEMADGQQEERVGGHPADTGRVKGTTRGALMVVGTMQVAKAFAKQMGMADLEWRQEGEHVQRAEFTEWPHSQQLEQAIAASAAREWVTEKATRTKWRFDVPRKRPSQEHHRWPPVYAARPSMVPQRGAVGSSSKVNAWEHPLPQTVRSSAASQEELRQLIKKEVASLLAPYERLLEETKTAAKTAIAGKDAEIASLKQELAEVKAQARSSAVPAADPMSPPDLKGPPGTNEWRQMLRECRNLSLEGRDAAHRYKVSQQQLDRMGVESTLQHQEIKVLQQQLKEMQHWQQQQLRAGVVHSLSELSKEQEQNQIPAEKRRTTGLTGTGTWVHQPEPVWPTQVTGFQHEAAKVPVASAVPLPAFSFMDAAVQKLPACDNVGNFVFQQAAQAVVSPAPSHPTLMKDGFVLKQPEAVTEAMAPVSGSSSKRQVSVGMTTEVLEVRAELADTPPRAPPSQRSKRQVSPGLNTPQAPAAKREMVEEEEEEEEEEGTDADVRRWMEAEHMEAESTEKGAEAEVQEGLEGEFSDGYDEEEADRAQTRQRGCLMESEGIQREEGARARRGQLFTVESSTMGG